MVFELVHTFHLRSHTPTPFPQEKYVCEIDPKKVNVLLMSKADLLSPQQRLVPVPCSARGGEGRGRSRIDGKGRRRGRGEEEREYGLTARPTTLLMSLTKYT